MVFTNHSSQGGGVSAFLPVRRDVVAVCVLWRVHWDWRELGGSCPWERCLVRWKHGHLCPLCQALWGEPHWCWGGELRGRTRTLQGVRSSGVAQFPICHHQGLPVWVHMRESKSHSYLGMLNLYNALARASWKRACVFFSCSYECK